jgi:hypothetical protein
MDRISMPLNLEIKNPCARLVLTHGVPRIEAVSPAQNKLDILVPKVRYFSTRRLYRKQPHLPRVHHLDLQTLACL